MQKALEQAMLAVGRSHPNLTVGAVLVREGRLLASGAKEVH
ncbi:hypothetical protein SAMN05443639_107367 [Stigmatella erecta]|uniref:Cytidine and deoxycytidylate deaminase zinc-binding region n=1 Tax=Stigmatella erecta TaxID=83460 RepID=A0A1I0JLY3_9BACT|nr:hypothetical protein SAMN05443639_107367 [Stigmatella erecta]